MDTTNRQKLCRWTLALATATAPSAVRAATPEPDVPAQQQQPAGAPSLSPRPGTGGGPPPPYTVTRAEEDYSYLRDPAKRTDGLDPLKYIPFGERGDVYLSLGGQARYRYEFFQHGNFGVGTQDENGYHLGRLFAHADLHLGPSLRAFVQGKSGLEDGREGGPRASDKDTFDVQQAFVDVAVPVGTAGPALTLRGGRQDLAYGAQRLIAPSDWSNVRRTFEGGRAMAAFSDAHSLDLFLVRPVVVDPLEPNVGDGDVAFAGVYDSMALPEVLGPRAKTKLELYGLGLFRQGAAYAAEGAGRDEDRYTVGVRLASAPKPFDFEIEADYQFGTFGGGGISAWAVAVEVGYQFTGAPLEPRLFLGLDVASGDDHPGDGDSGTFNQLFPSGHTYFGYVDVIGRQNIIDLHPGVELTIVKDRAYAKKLSLRADYHVFWRQSDDDAVYTAGGGVLRGDGGSSRKFVGSELDLLLNWQVDRHVAAYVGYSRFFAGGFIEETGPGNDISFFYTAVQFTF